jgi:predicted peptidase
VILFLHGAGERGSDGLLQTEVGLGTAVRRFAARYPALIVFPQARADSLWTGTMEDQAMAALAAVEREFRTDPRRVYLTGNSMGGYGTWHFALHHPGRFAALVVVCGGVMPSPFSTLAFPPPPSGGEDPYR